uniref:Disease resistance N-terminal domain-containing protein n=1 Tax=Aegilops tauschii subsp. strangulata TaxID=200361 RepID=A0A453HLS8_AEGTS
MKMTLESVDAVLRDAERESIKHKSMLLWLKQLKDATKQHLSRA